MEELWNTLFVPMYHLTSRLQSVSDFDHQLEYMLTYCYVTGTGRISVCWVSLCLRRSTLRWKARPQRSQANGLKPVCLRLWVIRLEDWLKALPHTWHLCGFSPVKIWRREGIVRKRVWNRVNKILVQSETTINYHARAMLIIKISNPGGCLR